MLYVAYKGADRDCQYRHAVITADSKYDDMIVDILNYLGYKYDAFGSGNESCFYIEVDDRDEYNEFMKDWKWAKKQYKAGELK